MGGMRSVGVVVDAPVFDDDFGFEQRIEDPQVQEFVAEAAVERLDPGVLPRRSWVDEHGVDAVGLAPFGDDDGDELRWIISVIHDPGLAVAVSPVLLGGAFGRLAAPWRVPATRWKLLSGFLALLDQ